MSGNPEPKHMLLKTVIKIDYELVTLSKSSVSQIYFELPSISKIDFEFSRFYCIWHTVPKSNVLADMNFEET